MCQLDEAMVPRQTCSNIIVDISVKVFLDHINILISRVWLKQIILHSVGGPHPISQRPLTSLEEEGILSSLGLILLLLSESPRAVHTEESELVSIHNFFFLCVLSVLISLENPDTSCPILPSLQFYYPLSLFCWNRCLIKGMFEILAFLHCEKDLIYFIVTFPKYV